MKKEYGFVLIAYITLQLSSIVGIPIVMFLGTTLAGYEVAEMRRLSIPIWLVFSFLTTFAIILILLRKDWQTNQFRQEPASVGVSIVWAVAGVFLAMFSQGLAASIEKAIGIEMGSENTKAIITLIESFPIIILVSSVIGPILEEIVFRKIIFGSLYKRFNFTISALLSSLIFAFAHFEPEHAILYSAMGFTFAFLYVKTKRIIVPIFAHVAMNTLVVLIQSVYKDEIEKMLKDAGQIKSFISFLFIR